MKKKIFLSKNRRRINISTKKYGRKSKRGKNSKLNKRSKRVKIVNTSMQKNLTKKNSRNIQKGGVWFEVRQSNGKGGNETVWYDLNKNNHDEDTKDPERTWRKHHDDTQNKDYWVNDAGTQSSWTLPPPNPAFEPHSHASLPLHSAQQQPYASFHNTTPEETFSSISELLFKPNIEVNPTDFLSKLEIFSKTNPTINGESQTILYAACRTRYVSPLILRILTKQYKCNPEDKSGEGFYPLGALMTSLRDNIRSGEYFDKVLVDKYIEAIKILFDFYSGWDRDKGIRRLIEQKNIHGLTAYDDFVTFLLYNFIFNCLELNEIIKLLVLNQSIWGKATILFKVCNASIIYPDLIKRLILCDNDVIKFSTVYKYSDYSTVGDVDPENSGYPITALIKSYKRIEEAGGDVKSCKDAIRIVSQHTDMEKISGDAYGKDIQSIVYKILNT